MWIWYNCTRHALWGDTSCLSCHIWIEVIDCYTKLGTSLSWFDILGGLKERILEWAEQYDYEREYQCHPLFLTCLFFTSFPFTFLSLICPASYMYIYIYTHVYTKRIIMIKPTTGTRDANSRSTWESMVVFSFLL